MTFGYSKSFGANKCGGTILMCSSASGNCSLLNTSSTTSSPLRYHSEPPHNSLNFLFGLCGCGCQMVRSTASGITRTLSWYSENSSQLCKLGTRTVLNSFRYIENSGGSQFVSHIVNRCATCCCCQPLIMFGLKAKTVCSAKSSNVTCLDNA